MLFTNHIKVAMPGIELINRIPRTVSLNDALYSRSLSYNKLPSQLLNLSVVKLDGSSFDVQIGSNSTVGELKWAIEEVFNWSPKVGQDKISWSHVWSHFCLCCEGEKLVNDRITIKSLGIKDGDQLQFIRNMSINHRPVKQRSKHDRVPSGRHRKVSSGTITQEDRGESFGDDHFNTDVQESNLDEDAIPKPKLKVSHFFKGWISYSKSWSGMRKGSKRGIRL